METKANHVLIGAFMLVLTGALFGFVIWLARFESGASAQYDIYFRDSVAGLDVGSVVRFNGVPVGQVARIALVPEDPRKVRVRIAISEDAQILEGTTATLEAQGLTGIAFVQLTGAMVGAPPLKESGPEGVPVISSRPSPLAELFTGAPQLLQQATVAVSRVGELLNEENRQSVANTLKNMETVSSGIARRTPEIERTLVELETTAKEVRAAATAFTALAQSGQAMVDNDARPMIAEVRKLAQHSSRLVAQLDDVVTENRPGLARFTEATVPEMTRLMIDLRELTRTLNRLAERMEQGSAQSLISGSKVPEYER